MTKATLTTRTTLKTHDPGTFRKVNYKTKTVSYKHIQMRLKLKIFYNFTVMHILDLLSNV